MTKPEDSPYIAWIDLECSGNRPNDKIIEIGAVMTDRDLNELSAKEIVVHLDYRLNDAGNVEYISNDGHISVMEPIVAKMHSINGLLADVSSEISVSRPDADAQMVEWIKKYTSGDHIPLAGSGVSHFDRAFIKRDLPRFDKYLSYWAYDTGVIRRTLKLFGIDTSMADNSVSKTHRALDDIRVHIEEMRRYKTIFTAWENIALVDAARKAVWPG